MKQYRVLLNQDGINIIPTIIANSFTGGISINRGDVGYHTVDSTNNEFTIGKTFVTVGNNYRQRAFLGTVANKETNIVELHATFDEVYSDVNVIEQNNLELLIEVFP